MDMNQGYQEIPTRQWVWCPDPTMVCVPGVVVARGKDGVLIVHTEDGEERQLDSDDALPVTIDVTTTVPDIAELTLNSSIRRGGVDEIRASSKENRMQQNLHARHEAQALEYALLYTLRTRFRDDTIYTECGASVLISINPHRPLPLYTPDMIQAYRHRQMLHEMPPHLFGLAENAKLALQESGEDQAIVLLGERGAGKSDAAKLVLQYLCHQTHTAPISRSKSRSNAGDMAGSSSIHVPIEEQMLHACTVLEAFGHAEVPNHANASYVLKIFSVMHTLPSERNFHIFHLLLAEAAVNPSLQSSLELGFDFAIAASAHPPVGRSEARWYQDVTASLTALRIPAHHVHNIMRVVSAILHLGNVKFVPAPSSTTSTTHSMENTQDAACMIDDATAVHLQLAATMLEVDASVLDHYFRTRKMVSSNHTSSLKIVSIHQATRARDTFCKNLYESLVHAIMFRMNASMRSKLERYEKSNIAVDTRGIHILDSFGYVTPGADAVQGFDTLCVHYWAEKVRSLYLSCVFPTATNLDVDVYVRMYEQSPVGIIPILTDQMATRAHHRQAQDAQFVNKLLVANESIGNALLQPVLPSTNNKKNYKVQFTIQHGNSTTITYEADDFVRRNNKSVSTTAAAILKSSKNSFVKGMVDRHGNSPTLPSPTTASTVATNFSILKQIQTSDNVAMELMQQASSLVAAIRNMGTHFVVCVNPQKDDQPFFDSRDVVRQLRAVDILNLIVSCQRNLTVKLSPPLFFSRYRHICGHRQTLESLIRSLIAIGVMDDLTWRVEGVPPQTVWLHVLQRKKLEKARELYLNACATMIQRNLQRSAFRKLCTRRLASLAALRAAVNDRDPAAIQTGLTDATSWMEAHGTNIRLVQDATQVVSQVAEESYLKSILSDAVSSGHEVLLQHAITTAQAVCPSWKHDLLTKGKAMLRKMSEAPSSSGASSTIRNTLLRGSLADIAQMNPLPSASTTEGMLVKKLLARRTDEAAAQKALASCVSSSGDGASTTLWTTCISKLLELGVVDETLATLKTSWEAWAPLRALVPMSRIQIEEALQRAVDTKCQPGAEICLNLLTDLGTNNDDLVLQAVALVDEKLPPAKVRPQAVALVDLALQSDSMMLLEAAMTRCRSVGMAQWDINVRKVEKALEGHNKERAALEDAWNAFLQQDLAKLHDIQTTHPLVATSPVFGFLGLLQAHHKRLQRLSKLPVDQRVQEAAEAGLLDVVQADLSHIFASMDQSRQVADLQHTLRFVQARLDGRMEVRADLLALVTAQTQKVLGQTTLHDPTTNKPSPVLSSALEDAGGVTKQLQKSLLAKSKLAKILKAPTEASLQAWLDEVNSNGPSIAVEASALQSATDVLRQLKASHNVESNFGTPSNDATASDDAVDTSLQLSDYDQLRLEYIGPLSLQWENRVVDQPLLKDQRTPWSIHVNRCILGYMRDRVMWFREMLAQSILQLALQQPTIVDEVLMQIMKQLTYNPRPESERRGWSLLALCLTNFSPSPQFAKYVASFVHSHDHPVALYCQTRLDTAHGGAVLSGFLPSLEELQAFDFRLPFVATIELMDGTVLTTNFPVTPELTVAHVVDVCAHFLGLQQGQLLGLAKDAASYLYHPHAYLGETDDERASTGSHRPFSVVLKLRLSPVVPVVDDANLIYQRLVYVQAMEDILQGHVPLLQIEPVLTWNVLEYLPASWVDDKSENEFAQCILHQINQANHDPAHDADNARASPPSVETWQSLYVDEAKKHRLFGSHFFAIQVPSKPAVVPTFSSSLPANLSASMAATNVLDAFDSTSVLAVNGMGVHFVDASHHVLLSWEHGDIVGVVFTHKHLTIQTVALGNAHMVCDRADVVGRLLEDYAVWNKTKLDAAAGGTVVAASGWLR
ncbi:hypothetical protein DYB32_001303 [Aphanomyces invadans]|uniref:Myosin motor domain-containing protein n=1 Tax=Aphanomyces invadans TaxID=157072 RepID=A0A418B764_9STRA|nr:hypothetical protein DYB32_001303 [Aphanomyces invadans]